MACRLGGTVDADVWDWYIYSEIAEKFDAVWRGGGEASIERQAS